MKLLEKEIGKGKDSVNHFPTTKKNNLCAMNIGINVCLFQR
jgi:hypothetical protein